MQLLKFCVLFVVLSSFGKLQAQNGLSALQRAQVLCGLVL